MDIIILSKFLKIPPLTSRGAPMDHKGAPQVVLAPTSPIPSACSLYAPRSVPIIAPAAKNGAHRQWDAPRAKKGAHQTGASAYLIPVGTSYWFKGRPSSSAALHSVKFRILARWGGQYIMPRPVFREYLKNGGAQRRQS